MALRGLAKGQWYIWVLIIYLRYAKNARRTSIAILKKASLKRNKIK